MARPLKQGLLYFPFDVDFFSDKKIKVVRVRFGAKGIMLYVYLLTEIYRNGYYVVADDDFICCAAADLGITPEVTRQIVKFFCIRSLFDDKLYTADTILSAKSIQRRYQEAFKSLKRDIIVDEHIWLLNATETLGCVKVAQKSGLSEKNPSFSEKNDSLSEKNPIKEKKSKEYIYTLITGADFEKFWDAYPRKVNKQAARESWERINPTAELVSTILAAVEQHKKSDQWMRENGRFIKNPANWLDGRAWEDILPQTQNQSDSESKTRKSARTSQKSGGIDTGKLRNAVMNGYRNKEK